MGPSAQKPHNARLGKRSVGALPTAPYALGPIERPARAPQELPMKTDPRVLLRECGACGRVNRIPYAHLGDRGRCGACRTPLLPVSEPLEVDEASFHSIVHATALPVLVDFWAPWCGPCRAAAPILRQVAGELAGRALVLKVNVDEEPALAERFGVQGIPHFLVLHQGRPIRQHSGLVDAHTLATWLA